MRRGARSEVSDVSKKGDVNCAEKAETPDLLELKRKSRFLMYEEW